MSKQTSRFNFLKRWWTESESTKPTDVSSFSTKSANSPSSSDSAKEMVTCKTKSEPGTSTAATNAVSTKTTKWPSDMSNINKPPTQPKRQSFHTSVISGKKRSVATHWYETHQWVEYIVCLKTQCFVKCVGILVTCSEDRFSHSGFSDWKHMHQACSRHETSKAHAVAFTKYVSYQQCQLSGHGNILNQLNKEAMNTRLIDTNWEHIKGVLDIVLFCAKQQISSHGHREDQEALNKGNFLELFKLPSKYDGEIQSRLEMPTSSLCKAGWA
ncbi:hypothetical protein KIL84_013448 [Mauremys mutica]|uniref:TTF-type domain-containing protein n=1 Tax=Mauremys mutica TaxID=74926 RepID=A0A9D3WY08_9SAUR|nr:hypothetical protein KIL84_013448 [Mauremys mutica]